MQNDDDATDAYGGRKLLQNDNDGTDGGRKLRSMLQNDDDDTGGGCKLLQNDDDGTDGGEPLSACTQCLHVKLPEVKPAMT